MNSKKAKLMRALLHNIYDEDKRDLRVNPITGQHMNNTNSYRGAYRQLKQTYADAKKNVDDRGPGKGTSRTLGSEKWKRSRPVL